MGTLANDTDVYYDPYDTGINTDPYPTYARLRDEAPLYYNQQYDFWAISRHSDVEKGLSNWEVFPTGAVTSSNWSSRNSTCPRGDDVSGST